MTHDRPFRYVLVLLVLFLVSCGSKDLRLTIRFETASGLVVGSDLVLSGVIVGEVVQLELTEERQAVVAAMIVSDYRHHVTEDSKFRIKKEGLFTGRRYIEVTSGTGEPAGDDAEFVGTVSGLDQFMQWGSELRDGIQDPALEERWGELVEAGRDALDQGQKEWEKLRPELESKAEELIDRAKREGPEAAERLRRELESLLEVGDQESEEREQDETI